MIKAPQGCPNIAELLDDGIIHASFSGAPLRGNRGEAGRRSRRGRAHSWCASANAGNADGGVGGAWRWSGDPPSWGELRGKRRRLVGLSRGVLQKVSNECRHLGDRAVVVKDLCRLGLRVKGKQLGARSG